MSLINTSIPLVRMLKLLGGESLPRVEPLLDTTLQPSASMDFPGYPFGYPMKTALRTTVTSVTSAANRFTPVRSGGGIILSAVQFLPATTATLLTAGYALQTTAGTEVPNFGGRQFDTVKQGQNAIASDPSGSVGYAVSSVPVATTVGAWDIGISGGTEIVPLGIFVPPGASIVIQEATALVVLEANWFFEILPFSTSLPRGVGGS